MFRKIDLNNLKFILAGVFIIAFTSLALMIAFNQEADNNKEAFARQPDSFISDLSMATDDSTGKQALFYYGSARGDLDLRNTQLNVEITGTDADKFEIVVEEVEDWYNHWETWPSDRVDAVNPPDPLYYQTECATYSGPKHPVLSSLGAADQFSYGPQSSRNETTPQGVSTPVSLREKHTGCFRVMVKPVYCTTSGATATLMFDPDYAVSPGWGSFSRPARQYYDLETTDPADPANCAANQPPVANDDSDSTNQDTPVTIDVLANDTDSDGILDPSTTTKVSEPTNGTATVNTDGTVTYTPNPGYTGTDSFTYTVNDDEGATSNVATVTITIASVNTNQPPVANNDSANVEKNVPEQINILTNDEDPDGTLDAGTVTIIDQPSNGTVTVNTDGTVTYTPDTDYTGTDSFTYTVDDNDGATSNVATVSIGILEQVVNQPPVANDDSANVIINTDKIINILTNDEDPDGTLDAGTVTIIDQPSNGTVTVNTDGTVTYTSDTDYTGTDSFTYTVDDNDGATSNVATVSINIAEQASPAPVANNDSGSTKPSDPITLDILANDTAPESSIDLSSVVIVGQPSNGTVKINADGTVTYAPNGSYTGVVSFTYKFSNEDGVESNVATVTINIDAQGSNTGGGADSIPRTGGIAIATIVALIISLVVAGSAYYYVNKDKMKIK